MSEKISSTLRKAKAVLWDGEGECEYTYYICHAIDYALGLRVGSAQIEEHPAILLLVEAGMSLDGGGMAKAFCHDPDFMMDEMRVKQIWRHAWLDLMIQFCLEEGL